MSQAKIISGRPDTSGPIMVAPYRARNALAQPIARPVAVRCVPQVSSQAPLPDHPTRNTVTYVHVVAV